MSVPEKIILMSSSGNIASIVILHICTNVGTCTFRILFFKAFQAACHEPIYRTGENALDKTCRSERAVNHAKTGARQALERELYRLGSKGGENLECSSPRPAAEYAEW